MTLLSVALLVVIVACAFIPMWYVHRRLVVVTVVGISMEPNFVEGDRVLVRRSRVDRVQRGDVIVLSDPESLGTRRDVWIIKRAAAVPGDLVPRDGFPALSGVPETVVPADRIVVQADNPSGADSRLWGYCDAHTLLGVAIRRMARNRNVALRNYPPV